MIRVEITATAAANGDRCWSSADDFYLFCQRGPRLLGSGIKWAEGKRALLEVSRRPIKGGAKVVVRNVENAEVNGRKVLGTSSQTAVSYDLERALNDRGLLGKTVYVRMKALPK